MSSKSANVSSLRTISTSHIDKSRVLLRIPYLRITIIFTEKCPCVDKSTPIGISHIFEELGRNPAKPCVFRIHRHNKDFLKYPQVICPPCKVRIQDKSNCTDKSTIFCIEVGNVLCLIQLTNGHPYTIFIGKLFA